MSSEKVYPSLAEENRPILILIVSVIAILMFVGVIGNAAVIYIFGSQLKNSTVHYFITVLAVFDFISCLFGFPLEIIEFYHLMEYPSIGLCKWQRFLTFGCSVGAIIVLLLIAIERYRKVCKPSKYQLNLRHAKYFTLVAGIFSVILATPMILFATNRKFQLKSNGKQTGYDCRLTSRYGRSPLYYFTFLLIFATVILVTMVSLYSLLWRTARKHLLQSDARFQQNMNNAEAGSSPASRQLSRTNRTVILVTILFTVSFFPTLILSIFADRIMKKMNYMEQIFFFMFVRMYILNSSFNPVVYIFCNKHFRHAFVKLLRKFFCLSPAKTQVSNTETS